MNTGIPSPNGFIEMMKPCLDIEEECLRCSDNAKIQGFDCARQCRVTAELCSTLARLISMEAVTTVIRMLPLVARSTDECARLCSQYNDNICKHCANRCTNLSSLLRDFAEKHANLLTE